MTVTPRLFAALFAALFVGALASPTAQQKSSKPSPAIEELLWLLPTDTETVMVTQPQARTRSLPVDVLSPPDGRVRFPNVGYKETLERHLSGAGFKASVEGSRRFAPPSGLGGMLYEGANIFLFDKPLAADGKVLMSVLQKQALRVDVVGGFTVVEFRDKLENDVWASYITVLRPNLLVIATNLDYLKELIGRRTTRTGARALPSDLREWSWMDAASSFWAVRHFRRDVDSRDPSSPFVKNAAASEFDSGAVGVATYAADDGRTMVVHYLSTGSNAEDIARRIWHRPDDGMVPTIRRAAPDAIEVRFTAGNVEDLSKFLFYLIAVLGHAIYL